MWGDLSERRRQRAARPHTTGARLEGIPKNPQERGLTHSAQPVSNLTTYHESCELGIIIRVQQGVDEAAAHQYRFACARAAGGRKLLSGSASDAQGHVMIIP